MKTIASFFIENSKLTVVLSIGLVVFGLMGLGKMNAESFPSVSMATGTIITSYEGATAKDIETKITKPLEDEIRGVAGLKRVRSISQAGLSTIVVVVDMDDPRVDVNETMADIQKAVDRTTGLPSDLRDAPKFTEMNSEEFPVFEFAITGSNIGRKRDLLADALKEDIEDLRTVKSVRLTGYAERAFHIKLDVEKLKAIHISTDEVLNKVRSRNTNTPGGAIKGDSIQKLVRIEGKIKTKEELENIVIRSNFTGQSVFLKDVAEVIDGEEELTTYASHNGEASTLAIVTKKSGADTVEMVNQIKAKMNQFKKRNPSYHFYIYNNEGTKVANRVDVLSSNALSGLVLVVVFLFFFLPGRIGLVASLSLPLAVMGTLGLMPSFGMNIDTITVLALVIALGMLVDNSVVIAENFTRLRQDGLPPGEAASESVRTLWLPITATAFTTIAAFMPMLVTKGVMGQFIRWIPVVVSISLIISLAESFFFLPMRLKWAGKVVKQKVENEHVDWFGKFESKFENLMDKLVSRRYIVSGIFSIVIIFSFFMMVKANKFILFPAEQTEAYIARVETPKGTKIEETTKAIEKLSQKVKAKLGDDVTHIIGRAGAASMGPGDPKAKEGNSVGMLSIYVSENFKLNKASTEVLKTLREVTEESIMSLEYEALVNGPPVGNAIEATFRSNDVEEIYGMVNGIKAELEKVDGISDLRIDDVIGDDEIFVDIDYEKTDRLGLDVKNIGQTIKTAVSGNRTAKVTLNNKDIDLIVRYKEPFRESIEDLKNIRILDRQGNLVSLGTFAKFRVEQGTPQIKRFDFKISKTLTGNVSEDKITSMVANQKLVKIFDELHLKYPGVSIKFGGAAENTKESMESLGQALMLSLIGIFALLVFLFKSYLRPAIIMSTIPLGLLGFSVAFFFHQRPISFLALIGVIGLGGIIVNSGIVLISFIDQMRAEGKLELHQILVKASGMRLRAVLVTSLTTISGLLPTAYGIGGNDPILIPMTLAMAWGLTSGTILTLIWVPCAYAILEDLSKLQEKILSIKLPFMKKEMAHNER
ncbi:MAG: multidrug efflux pump subunit AcrB [Bacteriovoracaceae bacterium]|jgi:multidrug efflux pump subunit AcrB